MKTSIAAKCSTVFTAVLLVLFLSKTNGPVHAEASTESVYERVMRTNELRCGYAIWPGLVEKDPNTGKLSGAFYDYMLALGESMQVKIDWVEEVDFGSIVEELGSGRVDAICSGIWTNAVRGKFLELTEPVSYQSVRAYARANDSRFDNNLGKINSSDVTISVVDGESAAVILKSDFPKAKSLSMPAGTAMSQMLLNVVHNKADLTFTDPGLAGEFMAKNPGVLREVPSAFPLRVYGNTIALKKGEVSLKGSLDVAARQLLGTGAVESILKQHEKYPGMFLRAALPFELPDSKGRSVQ